MKYWAALSCILAAASVAPAAETRFTSGPQEYEGQKYYWLAEWRLEVTLPDDVAPGDRFEVLFGSKGPASGLWTTSTTAGRGTLAEVRQQPFEWIPLPLGTADRREERILLRPRRRAGCLPGGRPHRGRVRRRPEGEPVRPASFHRRRPVGGLGRNARIRNERQEAAALDPAPTEPDWQRAERSARYAGDRAGQSATLAARMLPARP